MRENTPVLSSQQQTNNILELNLDSFTCFFWDLSFTARHMLRPNQVDIHLPILPRGSSSASASKVTSYNLPAIRSYLTRAKSSFPTVSIPDSITSYIQNDWVRLRKASASDTQHVNAAVAEDDLARWLRIAKLVAQSHIGDGGREVTEDIWRRTIALDTERKKRMMERS